MNIEEAKEKAKDYLSWNNIFESLPIVIVFAIILFAVDKIVNISGKIGSSSRFKRRKRYTNKILFEVIDSLGDNIQLLDGALGMFNIKLGDNDLKKAADFLQNLGTGGKRLDDLYQLLKPIISRGGKLLSDNRNYKDI